MNVYNTLDLYGAVTAYDADGNPTGFYLIDKKGVLPSNFTNTVKDLIKETGDLFYLIGNSSYYSGESISKKTEVTINVPVGGYIEISNSIYSDVALCANIIGLIIDGLSSAKDLVVNDTKIELIASKQAIIHDVLSEDFIGKKLGSVIKSVATDELKNANWNYSNYGECLQAVLVRLSDVGVDLIDSISKKIVSITGIGSITESIITKIVPTGDLINFLYDVMEIGDQAVTWITFQKSADFAKGIYVYAPSTGKSYSSNGIEVIPSSSTVESDIVFHSYLVVDKSEVPTNVFKGDSETYNIAMYRDGKETQLNVTITVRIPLSDKFKGLDKSTIIVYRHNDDGTITNMNASIVDGYAVFETNHLSYYSIVTEEDAPNPITYTVTFNPNGGNLTGSATLTTSADGKLSSLPSAYRSGYTFDGWFTLLSGGEKITTNYIFTSDATVYAHWSKIDTSTTPSSDSSGSSNSDPTYSITVPSRVPGGTVKLSPANASAGQRVTITVKPNSGYELNTLTVTDSKGNTLTLIDQGNGKYTFIMPNSRVSIDVSFKATVPAASVTTINFTDVPANAYYTDAVA